MADLGSTPSTYSTTSVSDKTVKNTLLSRGFKLTPDSYTTVDELIKATREDVLPELVQIYGDQGLTGFLKLTGAVNSGGSSDQIDWWEAGRRHRAYTLTDDMSSVTGASANVTDSDFIANVQKNDVVMEASTGVRFIVQDGGAGAGTPATPVTLVKMDNTVIADADLTDGANNCVMLVIGNIYAQGTNQPTGFTDPGIKRYTNPYMIVKDRYEVNGSQATNVGYVNLGGGDYRWFMYGEKEQWLDLRVTSQLSRTEVSSFRTHLLTHSTASLSSTTSSWSWISKALLLSTQCT